MPRVRSNDNAPQPKEPAMNTTTTDRLLARTSALMLAVIVTVATLAGIDSIASHDPAATMAQAINTPRS
jgi:hypothetical protein